VTGCNEEARKCHLYPANPGPEVLTAEEVASRFSMKGEGELWFRDPR
jgi:hypothetical protein